MGTGGGSKPGKRRGGRKPGARNKVTIEREEIARLELAAEKEAREAAAKVAGAKAALTKLGKDVLEEFMMLFRGMAAAYQPAPPGQPARQGADEAKFVKYAVLARDTAADLAEYQSPKYRAIAVMAPPPDLRPGDDAKVIDLAAADPTRAADVYRRLIQAPLKATG